MRVVREDLYDKAGDLIKEKRYTKLEMIGNHNLPTTIEMMDVSRKHIPRLEMKDVKVNEKIPDRIFSTKHLEKLK